MGFTINQIKGILSTYHRQQFQSRISEERLRRSGSDHETAGDKTPISAEAKRLQVYQKTTEDILKRLQDSRQDEIEEQLERHPIIKLLVHIQKPSPQQS
jgi:hypothetical protein